MDRDQFDLGSGGFPWQRTPSGLATALIVIAIVLGVAAGALVTGQPVT